MKILKDDELLSYIKPTNPNTLPIITGLEEPRDWYSQTSPIQPTSIDLHIGDIFIPGTKKDALGGETQPLGKLILNTGQTAVLTTKEEFHLPSTIAGIGFPPSRVSFQGLLMTNPGHLDPGFVGQMRFSVINMGKEAISLRKDDPIVTVLLFELQQPVTKNYFERNGSVPPGHLKQEDINRLSPDFLEVDCRAENKAKEILKNAEKRWMIAGTIVGALLTTAASILVAILSAIVEPNWKDPLTNLTLELASLKEQMKENNLNASIDEIRVKLAGLEKNLSSIQTQTKIEKKK